MNWLQGKKTYIAAIALILLGILGFWFGVVDEFSAIVLLVLAFGLFGVRDAIARTYAKTLLDAVEAGKTVRSGKQLSAEQKAELVQDVKNVITEEIARSNPVGMPSLPGQSATK